MSADRPLIVLPSMRDSWIVNDQIEAVRWSFSELCEIVVVDVLNKLHDLPARIVQISHQTQEKPEASPLHANFGIRFMIEQGIEFSYALTIEDDTLPIKANLDEIVKKALKNDKKTNLVGFLDTRVENKKYTEKQIIFEMSKTMSFWKHTGNTAPPKYPIRTAFFLQDYELAKKLHKSGFYGKDVHDWPFPGSFFQSWAAEMVGANTVFLDPELLFDPLIENLTDKGLEGISEGTLLVSSVRSNSNLSEEKTRAFFKQKRQRHKTMVAL